MKIEEFELLKINRGRKKICNCKTASYEVDTVNRIIMCLNCGSIIEPFEAVLKISEKIEEIQEYQRKIIDKTKAYTEEADKEFKRMIKNRVFREMDYNYKNNLLPKCPECDKIFDPAKIKEWTNRAIIEAEV